MASPDRRALRATHPFVRACTAQVCSSNEFGAAPRVLVWDWTNKSVASNACGGHLKLRLARLSPQYCPEAAQMHSQRPRQDTVNVRSDCVTACAAGHARKVATSQKPAAVRQACQRPTKRGACSHSTTALGLTYTAASSKRRVCTLKTSLG